MSTAHTQFLAGDSTIVIEVLMPDSEGLADIPPHV